MPGGAVVCTWSMQTSEPAATSANVVPLPVATTISGSSWSSPDPAFSTVVNDQSPEQKGPESTFSAAFGMPGLPLISVRIWAPVGAPVQRAACDGVGVGETVVGGVVVAAGAVRVG